MRPVVTVAEMRAADAAAPVPEETLVRRAGTAAAVAALRMLGGAYARRVVVVAGKGNNGADGRVAAQVLARRGARVTVVAPGAPVDDCDLVVDAALGTGLRGPYEAPAPPARAEVLAVDIPSGVDGDTGAAPGRPMVATRTVTFGALKPGLLQGEGPRFAGRVDVADIGLGQIEARISLMEDADLSRLVPRRPAQTHKWATAVCVVAGSPGMEGAATLAARGASRAGAGMVRLGVPGSAEAPGLGHWPGEAVRFALPSSGWAGEVLEVLERCRALVIGPGLGRAPSTVDDIRSVVARARVPVVVDADALFALGDESSARRIVAGDRPVVVTPHDGEHERLTGAPPGPDRVAAARRLAGGLGAVALVKGSLTAVASPFGEVRLSSAGSSRLATAGTGDVLSGVIGAFLARGAPPLEAAALAAHVHGRAASDGPAEGLVAVDLPELISARLSRALDPVARGTARGDG
ncbi:MAG: NAD(P)H-hydrate dehydratase [Actinomycetota bacterium]|nr:NAD(P)H-hydrate dehydratase [Actinomycetota bacterium]